MATTETVTTGRVVGTSVPRKEDRKLVTGNGQFIDNINLPGQVWLAVVRSPYAHARIGKVDLAAARKVKGVVAAFSGAELAADWAGSLPCAWPVTEDIRMPSHFPLAFDKARHVGDGVAVVVAETRAIAKDAAELVEVDYEPLDAVADVGKALDAGAPLVHDDLGTNECYVWKLDAGEVDQAFAEADVTVKQRYRQQRLIPVAMEPRGALAQELPGTGELTLWSSTQIPHIARLTLAGVVGIPEARLRVIAPDVGGGFGSKLDVYAEEALCLALARRLHRAGQVDRGALGGRSRRRSTAATSSRRSSSRRRRTGSVTAVRVRLVSAMGAYLQLVTPGIPLLGAWIYGGCYDIPAYSFECTGVFTHTTPTDAYRGAGRPEATYAIERAIDALAIELGMDPVELRRRNFITEFPATIASGLTIDSGDYDASLDKALELLDLEAVRAEQAERRERGDTKQLGIGFSTYVEMCGLAPSRDPRRDPLRRRRLGRGDDPLPAERHGAGAHRHVAARAGARDGLVADRGRRARLRGRRDRGAARRHDRQPARDGHVRQPQPHRRRDRAPQRGPEDRREGADARRAPARRRRERARLRGRDASAAADDCGDDEGARVRGLVRRTTSRPASSPASRRRRSTTRRTSAGRAARTRPSSRSTPRPATCSCSATSRSTTSARSINPMIVDGQIHGGITQGVAQALYEEAVYDEDGALLTSSLTNYLVPSAAEVPNFELDRTETPSPTNPLGVKGVGETGAIASPAAVMNAVVDALAPFGVTDIDMPATPERVWRAIEEARR